MRIAEWDFASPVSMSTNKRKWWLEQEGQAPSAKSSLNAKPQSALGANGLSDTVDVGNKSRLKVCSPQSSVR